MQGSPCIGVFRYPEGALLPDLFGIQMQNCQMVSTQQTGGVVQLGRYDLHMGEALALTWADYDDYSKTILIDKNMVYVDGEKITQTPKTESGERVIVLNKQAVMDLQMLRKQFDEQSEIIDQRMAEELREAELNYAGPEQKSAKRIIKEKYDAIRREHKYICGSSNFPFGSFVQRSMEDLKDF